jgi:hypothetical protein
MPKNKVTVKLSGENGLGYEENKIRISIFPRRACAKAI